MPPFATHAPSLPAAKPLSVVTLNVGGQIFQTTRPTLSLAGPTSILRSPPAFVDRDPALFSQLLSFLRTGRLPSSLSVDLLREAQFYDITLPVAAPLLHPFSLRPSLLLPLPGRDPPSSLHYSSPSAVLHVPHGSRITTYDPSLLRRTSTILTPLPSVDHVLPLPIPDVLAAGASDFPGLHILDSSSLRSVLHWSPYPQPSNAPKSTVSAVEASGSLLFSSFDSCRRNANVIAAYDLATLQPSLELARQEIFGAEVDSAIPASKLRWTEPRGLLMAAGSYSGPFGLVGTVRLWDVRSGKAVWEAREKEDCFADVAVSDELDAVFKVGAGSGDVCMVDLRRMGEWEKVGRWGGGGGGRKGKEGVGCRMECYGDKVFCSRGGEVEMWSEVVLAGEPEKGRLMRSNVLGRVKDGGGSRSKITGIGFVGNRMVVIREGEIFLEVWESSVEA